MSSWGPIHFHRQRKHGGSGGTCPHSYFGMGALPPYLQVIFETFLLETFVTRIRGVASIEAEEAVASSVFSNLMNNL